MQVPLVEGEVPTPRLLGLNREEVPGLDVPRRRLHGNRGRQLIQVCLQECPAPGAVTDAEADALDPLALLKSELEVLPLAQDELPVEGHVLQAVGFSPGDLLDVDPGLGAGAALVLVLPGTLPTVLEACVPPPSGGRG